jgi:hypothetical protein
VRLHEEDVMKRWIPAVLAVAALLFAAALIGA